jgi:hypothetical protein
VELKIQERHWNTFFTAMFKMTIDLSHLHFQYELKFIPQNVDDWSVTLDTRHHHAPYTS